jgi:hypothetical protein
MNRNVWLLPICCWCCVAAAAGPPGRPDAGAMGRPDGGSVRVEVEALLREGRELLTRSRAPAETKQARSKLERCVQLDPENWGCWKALAAACARTAKVDKDDRQRAALAFERYLTFAPEDEPAQRPATDWP